MEGDFHRIEPRKHLPREYPVFDEQMERGAARLMSTEALSEYQRYVQKSMAVLTLKHEIIVEEKKSRWQAEQPPV